MTTPRHAAPQAGRLDSQFAKLKAKLKMAIILDGDLTPSMRIIGWIIADHLNPVSGDAWPSEQRLAHLSKLNVRTVKRAVAALSAPSGWFMVEMDGSSYRYLPNSDRFKSCASAQSFNKSMANTGDGVRSDQSHSVIEASSPAEPVGKGVDSGQDRPEEGTFLHETASKNVPQSSLIKFETRRELLDSDFSAEGGASLTQGTGQQRRDGKTPIVLLEESDRRLTANARANGARHFAWLDSKPWRAWADYRGRAGLGPLPIRQHIVEGRLLIGSDVPSLTRRDIPRGGALTENESKFLGCGFLQCNAGTVNCGRLSR